jgi:hypothetical protein
MADLLAVVERIRPVLEGGGVQAEAERALPDSVYDAMLEAGLFRMLVPGAFGGLELDPIEAYSVFEAVTRVDSAAGWNLQISAGMGSFAIWLPEAGAKEVYSRGPDAILAGGLFPAGPSVRIDGGWRGDRANRLRQRLPPRAVVHRSRPRYRLGVEQVRPSNRGSTADRRLRPP